MCGESPGSKIKLTWILSSAIWRIRSAIGKIEADTIIVSASALFESLSLEHPAMATNETQQTSSNAKSSLNLNFMKDTC